jgi:hypothetical protein
MLEDKCLKFVWEYEPTGRRIRRWKEDFEVVTVATLRKERKLEMSENKVLRKIFRPTKGSSE